MIVTYFIWIYIENESINTLKSHIVANSKLVNLPRIVIDPNLISKKWKQ